MKKRFEKVVMDIATSDFDDRLSMKKHIVNGRYFVTDGCRVAEFDSDLSVLDSGNINKLDKYMDEVTTKDYTIFDLPSVDDIKQNIRNLCGRKLDHVVYKNEFFAINARWLYKAMEGLGAKKCYFDRSDSKRKPIFFFENDDVTSVNKIAICPVNNNTDFVGFYVC